MKSALLCLLTLCFAKISWAQKQRSWLGPNNFLTFQHNSARPTSSFRSLVIESNGKAYGFGGLAGAGAPLDDRLYVFDPATRTLTDLTDLSKVTPPARKSHGFSSSNGKLFVFGGQTNQSGSISGSISNDFYSWDPSSLEWKNLSNISINIPSPRQNFGMACVNDRLYVFGGDNGSNVLNEFYEYNISSREWNFINISDAGPTQRTGHGFASAEGNLYVFGGRDRIGTLQNDLWEFNPVTYTWTRLSSGQDSSLEASLRPQERSHLGLTNLRGSLVVFGGENGSGYIRVFPDVA